MARPSESELRKLRAQLGEVHKAMAEAGVQSVLITYDGQGDDGGITDVRAFRAPAEGVEPPDDVMWDEELLPRGPGEAVTLSAESELDLDGAARELAWDLLYAERPGWEINEGSFGTLTVVAGQKTVAVDHRQREEYDASFRRDLA